MSCYWANGGHAWSKQQDYSKSVIDLMYMLMMLQDVEYDPRRNSEYWQTRPVAVLKRSLEIGMHPHVAMLCMRSQSSRCLPH